MEKMQLGSPAGSPAQATPYLPNFLMGENTPTNHHHRSFSNSPTASPDFTRASMQQKFLTNLQSPQPLVSNSSFIQHQQQQPLFQAQVNNAPAASNTSISGPPINSLYDNFKNDKSFQTPTKPFAHQSMHQDTPINRSGFNQSRIMSPIPNMMTSEFNSSYPVAIQPSFTNHPSMSGVKNHEFWITVFGFPATSTSIVLSHFSGCGTIIDKVCSAGNWIHLRFSSRGECEKALLYNGKIIGNNLMIGVIRCQDESVFLEKENFNESQQASVSRVRSLTQAAYKSAKHDTEVVHGAEAPQKSNGIVSRAVDLLFGW